MANWLVPVTPATVVPEALPTASGGHRLVGAVVTPTPGTVCNR